MAVNITIVRAGARTHIADVTSTADADVAAVIPHGLGFPPEDVQIEALQVEYYTSLPILGAIDATNVNLVLANAGGSGAADPQIRVIARLPEDTLR